MKFSQKRKQYENSTKSCTFNMGHGGYSYDWYQVIRIQSGRVLFNTYNYSNTTVKHQYARRSLLRELNLKIDVEIEAPRGLNNPESIVQHYNSRISELLQKINNPRTHKTKNQERKQEVLECIEIVRLVKELYDINPNIEAPIQVRN